MTKPYPLSAVRALILHAQGLDKAGNSRQPTLDAIYDTIERLNCIQIDTLQMVQRSHYVAIWSRLGKYDPSDLKKLVYDNGHRRLFEYWLHAASIIPLSLYRYCLPQMRRFRERGGWIKDPENRPVFERVMERIRREGAVRAADFKNPVGERRSWWNWKPAKRALETGYNRGELMIADRVNFQRVYDLTERVLPGWVDTTAPTREEADYYLLERSVKALGIGTPGHAADYLHMKRGAAKPHIEAMLASQTIVPVQAETFGGEVTEFIVHRDMLSLLEQAAAGQISAQRTTFLNPFDSLFWGHRRDTLFWNFRKVLEAYKPADQREWGYYCLPILHKDRLVGRFDPKLERKTGTLRLKALYLEPGIEPDETLVADTAAAMHDFLAFHEAGDVVIEQSDPPAFGERLVAAL